MLHFSCPPFVSLYLSILLRLFLNQLLLRFMLCASLFFDARNSSAQPKSNSPGLDAALGSWQRVGDNVITSSVRFLCYGRELGRRQACARHHTSASAAGGHMPHALGQCHVRGQRCGRFAKIVVNEAGGGQVIGQS